MRAVAEMVEEARAAEVKAAVEKAAAAARVAMAAMRQPVACESKHCLNRQMAHQHVPLNCKSCVTQTGGPLCCFHRYMVALHSMHYCPTTKRSTDLGCMRSSVRRLGKGRCVVETDPAAEGLVGGRAHGPRRCQPTPRGHNRKPNEA